MTRKKVYRVLIADDHAILRDGLQALLSTQSDFEVLETYAGGREVIAGAGKHKPDIIIMDLTMPATSGIEAIAQIKKRHPAIKIVALTFHVDDSSIHATLKAGADGYVLKDDSRVELFTALRTVLNGNRFLSPRICNNVVSSYLAGGAERTPGDKSWEILTRREREIIKLIAEGQRTREIADYLSLSPKTVEKHRTNLMKKLDLHTISAVTTYAIQSGFV